VGVDAVPNTQRRSSGFGQSIVMILTAFMLGLVGYFYNKEFLPIGLTMFISIITALILTQRIINKKWLLSL
jgi:hypothetical protein